MSYIGWNHVVDSNSHIGISANSWRTPNYEYDNMIKNHLDHPINKQQLPAFNLQPQRNENKLLSFDTVTSDRIKDQ